MQVDDGLGARREVRQPGQARVHSRGFAHQSGQGEAAETKTSATKELAAIEGELCLGNHLTFRWPT